MHSLTIGKAFRQILDSLLAPEPAYVRKCLKLGYLIPVQLLMRRLMKDKMGHTRKLVFLNIIVLLISSSLSVNLSGLLSKAVCDVPTSVDISPLCKCINTTSFDSLEAICGNINAASECLEQELANTKGPSSFLEHSFDQKNFKTNMIYMCDIAEELGDKINCINTQTMMKCEKKINTVLIRTDLDQETTCNAIDAVSDCYWNSLKDVCPPRGRYLYSKLAEVYLPNICSKFDSQSKGDLCRELHREIPSSYTQCVEQVESKARCLEKERNNSLHHEDQYWETGFELSRYTFFSKYICSIENDRDRECSQKHKPKWQVCQEEYGKAVINHTSIMKNGGKVPVQDICRILEVYMDCMSRTLQGCPTVEVTYFHSVACGVMPKQCHCPVNTAEIMGHSTNSFTARRPTQICQILVLIYFLFCIL